MSSEDIAARRQRRSKAEQDPFAVGPVEVLRSSHEGVQVQGGCLKGSAERRVRMWLAPEWLHATNEAHTVGTVARLVLKREHAIRLGFRDVKKRGE